MLRWLWHHLIGRPHIFWQRSIVELRELEGLVRTGLAALLLAQEKARLDFLSALEAHRLSHCRLTQNRMETYLMQL